MKGKHMIGCLLVGYLIAFLIPPRTVLNYFKKS